MVAPHVVRPGLKMEGAGGTWGGEGQGGSD